MSALPLSLSPEKTPDPQRLTIAWPEGAIPCDFRHTVRLAPRQPLCEIHEATDLSPGELIRSDEDLVVRLCRLPIDLAAPLLRASLPTLTTPALLALIAATGEAHHRLIAERPHLDWRVIKALIRSHNDEVMAALIRNPALSFDEEDQLSFVRRAVESAVVRAAILSHEGLPVAKSQLRLSYGDGQAHGNLKLVALVRGGEAAGFVREMARRLRLDTTGLRRILASESAVPLALAFCAAGLDRAVFLHILSVWQGAYEAAPRMTETQKPLVLSVFSLDAVEARRRLAVLIDQTH